MNDSNVYRESRLEGRRRFELTDDGVRVSANFALGASIETVVRYDQLEPTITVIRMHHPLFWWSMLGAPTFAVTLLALVTSLKMSPFGSPVGLAITGTVISSIVALMTRHRIEYARFCSPVGMALLDVARSGPDQDRFDSFVSEIQVRIQTKRGELA